MLIEEKIKISSRRNYISLIEEGLFLKAYNQSAFIVNQVFQQNLKLSCNIVKKLQNQMIVYCAFPKIQVNKRFSKAHKTSWGFEIRGEFNLTFYEDWFEKVFHNNSIRCVKDHLTINQLKDISHIKATFNNEVVKKFKVKQGMVQQLDLYKTYSTNIQLTGQQLTFLINWQRGIYPLNVNENFIENLKDQLLVADPILNKEII